MNTQSVCVVFIGVLLLIGSAVFWSPNVRSQINAAPAWVPIGVSASGNTSTVWFHEPSSRQAVACQTMVAQGSGIQNIQCVATTLP